MSCLKKLLGFIAAFALLSGAMPAALAAEQPLYTALIVKDSTLREQDNTTSKILARIPKGDGVEILRVDPDWVLASYEGETGYVARPRIYKVTPIDPVNTPPYGVFKHTYMAVTEDVTPVLLAPQADAEAWVTLQPGAKLSILDITDGWARIPYWRSYGYVDTRLLKDLTPVSPTDTPVSSETPIAAFTSFYHVEETEANIGRMKNIDVACNKLNRVLAPGEELDFNNQIGPYSRANGYFKAPILIEGGSSIGYGGGTCQVSSTLYNALLQLPNVTIIYRHPHGPSGAKYLPHGVDAAVGREDLNLQIRNDYDFPIRIEASAQDGALFMCVWKQ
jgi:SH3-like domain-containing protein